MNIWPEYVLLRREISHENMRKENVLDVLKRTYERYGREFKDIFYKQIDVSVVLIHYNSRTYRVDDIQWHEDPLSTFSKSEGSSISYGQYYTGKYQFQISDMNQPLLIFRA